MRSLFTRCATARATLPTIRDRNEPRRANGGARQDLAGSGAELDLALNDLTAGGRHYNLAIKSS